jgi:FixJ family two-component response regulator
MTAAARKGRRAESAGTGERLVSAKASGPDVVYVLDHDELVRDGFVRLLRSAGLEPRPFGSVDLFLAHDDPSPRACVILDMEMPDLGRHYAQLRLREHLSSSPVIAISAGDDAAWARAYGAALFLRKPVDAQALLDAIEWVTDGSGSGS